MTETLLGAYRQPVLPMIGPFSKWGAFGDNAYMNTAPASATWESASRAVYYPIWVPTACLINRVWWVNGATVSGGATVEAGIYRDAGAKSFKPGAYLTSASATQGTANNVQFVNLGSAVMLGTELWWLALSSSSATNTTFFRLTTANNEDSFLRYQEASASPLPTTTATPVASSNSAIWMFGVSTNTAT